MEKLRCREPQSGPPSRGIDDKHEPATIEVRQPRMRGQTFGQAWA